MNLDLSASKKTMLREGIELQFRAEVFNIMNHPNFTQPVQSVTSPQFGQITAQYNQPRLLQFALRLKF